MKRWRQLLFRSTFFLAGLVPFAIVGLVLRLIPARTQPRSLFLPRFTSELGWRFAEWIFPGIISLSPFGDDYYYAVKKIDCPRKVKTGDVFPVTITLWNLGGQTWRGVGSPNPVRLGTWAPENRSSPFHDPDTWHRPDRPGGITDDVQPEATGAFQLRFRAPAQAGIYREEFAPVADGLTWFPGAPLTLILAVEGSQRDLRPQPKAET